MMRRTISLLRSRKSGIQNSDSSNFVGERKTEMENPNDSPAAGVHEGGVGSSVSGSIGGDREIGAVGERKREDDSPPADDVCPICFGDFTFACKTNCGHWFCSSCILQFWNYKPSLQKCKCPICCRLISTLTPEVCLLSRQEKEVIEVLENVHRYNGLYQGGVRGLLQNALSLPLFIKRMFQGLMDPDRFRVNYYTARFVGLLLGLMYQISPFEFIPTGGYPAPRLFEFCAISLVVILCLVGLCCRAYLRMRMRRLAAAHT